MPFRIRNLLITTLPHAEDCPQSTNDCPGGCSNGDTSGCTANTGSERCCGGGNSNDRSINCNFAIDPEELVELHGLLEKALVKVHLTLQANAPEKVAKPTAEQKADVRQAAEEVR